MRGCSLHPSLPPVHCSWDGGKHPEQQQILCYVYSELNCSFLCQKVPSLDKREGFLCPGASGLFSQSVAENFLGRCMTIMTQACV